MQKLQSIITKNIQPIISNGQTLGILPKEDNLFLEAQKTEKLKAVNIPIILQVLQKGMLLLGIKGDKHPDELTMQLIVAELRSHYIGLSIGELDLAFTLASRGQLDFENETYQSFSVVYMNRMLSSYSRWAATKHFVDRVVETKQISQPLPDDEIIQISLDSYNRFKQWWTIFNCLKTFNILHGRKLVGDNVEEIIKITEVAMRRRMDRADTEDKKDILAEIKDDDSMELNCRRMAVALYFNSLTPTK